MGDGLWVMGDKSGDGERARGGDAGKKKRGPEVVEEPGFRLPSE